MMYVISYTRNGKPESETLTLAQCRLLAEYLQRTFRITADIQIAA